MPEEVKDSPSVPPPDASAGKKRSKKSSKETNTDFNVASKGSSPLPKPSHSGAIPRWRKRVGLLQGSVEIGGILSRRGQTDHIPASPHARRAEAGAGTPLRRAPAFSLHPVLLVAGAALSGELVGA